MAAREGTSGPWRGIRGLGKEESSPFVDMLSVNH